MRESRILYFALGVLFVTSIGAVSLHDDGIEFPDGSFQETASILPAATAVQGKVGLVTPVGGAFCTEIGTLFSVPAGKRLVVEWLSVESAIFGGVLGSHPVEVDIITHNGIGQVFHPLVRIDDPVVIGDSFFIGNRWSGPVTLYSEASQPLQARMCLEDNPMGEGIGTVGFSGYLIDV